MCSWINYFSCINYHVHAAKKKYNYSNHNALTSGLTPSKLKDSLSSCITIVLYYFHKSLQPVTFQLSLPAVSTERLHPLSKAWGRFFFREHVRKTFRVIQSLTDGRK